MFRIHAPKVRQLATDVAAGRRRAVDVIRATIASIAPRDERIHAFLEVLESDALADAERVDAAVAEGRPVGPLAGVPVAVKDNIATLCGRTTCGSRILANYRSPYEATAIRRLRAAGGIVIGKTNCDEFAMGSSTENSAFGPTRNPWDETRVPGGSSGGSAAAVAAGMTPLALGSDTGGSVRQPASLCGVVGMKPTYGRVSRFGLVAYGSSLDQIGPLAGCVEDAAVLLSVIAGRDERDATSSAEPVPDYVAALADDAVAERMRRLRIGLPVEYFGKGLDAEVRAAVESAVGELEKWGATVVRLTMPHSQYVIAVYYLIATAEASSNLARFDGVHYGRRTERPRDVGDLYSASRDEGFGAEVKRRILLGTFALSAGYYDAYYDKALRARALIRRDFERAFESVDLLACPTAPTPAFRLGEKTADPLQMYLADVYTTAANLAGVPAISVPCGLSSSGLPIGLQLLGPHFSETMLFQAARAVEATRIRP